MRRDESTNKDDIFRGNGSAPISPLGGHLAISLPESKPERKSFLRSYTPPHRRCIGLGIASHQEQLRLMGSQRFRRFRAGRPPLETPFRQPFGGKPESLRVIRQYPDRLSAPATE